MTIWEDVYAWLDSEHGRSKPVAYQMAVVNAVWETDALMGEQLDNTGATIAEQIDADLAEWENVVNKGASLRRGFGKRVAEGMKSIAYQMADMQEFAEWVIEDDARHQEAQAQEQA